MRLRTKTIGFFLLAVLACSEGNFDVNDFMDHSSIKTLNGTWKVISFEDFQSDKVEFKTQENSWGRDIVVTFNDRVDPKRFSGRNTTNSVFGQFDYVGKRHFKLHSLGTTFVNQPEWGNKFVMAIHDGNVPFKISKRRLRLYFDNNTKSVTLARE